jgi:ornithine cyclodeaminase/alanine dehydrogenase
VLYLNQAEVAAALTPADAITVVEAALTMPPADEQPGQGGASVQHLAFGEGELAVALALDPTLSYAGISSSTKTSVGPGSRLVLLFSVTGGGLEALVDAAALAALRAGALSAVAARRLAREGARSLGVIGCGRLAAAQIACLRLAVPTLERISVYCREPKRLARFCRESGCEAAASSQQAASSDLVVTATSSRDPVIRGDWLGQGALVCAVGGSNRASRELDNGVLRRASFVCCDGVARAQLEAGDLAEPVRYGVLDWLEVHELADVVAGVVQGRASPEDIVVFKSVGEAAYEVAVAAAVVERARAVGLGQEL